MTPAVTDAELTLLGLLAELPRHGYELEHVIVERGVREWTALGFSSIYYLLDKLANRELIETSGTPATGKSRTVFRLTAAGCNVLTTASLDAITVITPIHARVLVGIANSPGLPRDAVLTRLRERAELLEAKIAELQSTSTTQSPLPPTASALFDYSESMLRADLQWTHSTIRQVKQGNPHG